MATVRRVVELGRAARAESGVKTRQPLARALVAAAGWDAFDADLRHQVADELNVIDVQGLSDDTAEGLVDVEVKANFRSLGKRFGQRTPTVAAAVAAADAAALVHALRTGQATVTVDNEVIDLTDDDVIVTESPRQGWAVASDEGLSCALDLTLTDDLVRAGVARDAVRAIQEARKNAGLDVTDRITLTWATDDPEVARALEEHADTVAGEVLALTMQRVDVVDTVGHRIEVAEPALTIGLDRVNAAESSRPEE
jgi:isoleucyl-tRNA synthetase